MLKSTGRLLVSSSQIARRIADMAPRVMEALGYRLEPLLPGASEPLASPDINSRAFGPEHWALAQPLFTVDGSGWDQAHDLREQLVQQGLLDAYVEPDLEHPNRLPASAASARANEDLDPMRYIWGSLDPHWPPHAVVSPAWHREKDFSDFDTANQTATGRDVRIAHLDTGYHPSHFALPPANQIDTRYAYDYVLDRPWAIDPGTPGALRNPWHGTATLCLLAGGQVDLIFLDRRSGSQARFKGVIGGAPDATIVPVRIHDSVVHLYTSTMARGLFHAWDKASCGVVTLSAGGLPSKAWASAVNHLYENGVILCAASGDGFRYVVSLPTHYTVYPAAFRRAITVLGVTYENKPYIASHPTDMQGCWGPDVVMEKAISAPTPNIFWACVAADEKTSVVTIDGAGTSSSTPQVAAACALWLETHQRELTQYRDWQRVELCRRALFISAKDYRQDVSRLGNGRLDAEGMLKHTPASLLASGPLFKEDPDVVHWYTVWRLLLGLGPSLHVADARYAEMLELEVTQNILTSEDHELLNGIYASDPDRMSAVQRAHLRNRLRSIPGLSSRLQQHLK